MKYYTDGACSGNPGPGGFGIAIFDNEDNLIDFYGEDSLDTTNNREELKAILWVMKNHGTDVPAPEVYTDSAYCYNTFTTWMYSWQNNDWKRNKGKTISNLDLIQEYYLLEKNGYKIILNKVKGHSGIKGNETADAVATGKLRK